MSSFAKMVLCLTSLRITTEALIDVMLDHIAPSNAQERLRRAYDLILRTASNARTANPGEATRKDQEECDPE